MITPSPLRRSRLLRSVTRRGLLVAARSALALGLGVAGALSAGPTAEAGGASSSWTGRVYHAWPGADLQTAVQHLRAGDTLLLEPGTYTNPAPGTRDPRLLRPWLRAGTTTHPIKVEAADPARPPLIVGAVVFDFADYWRVAHLRIQGTVAGRPSLEMNGGHDWVVADSEVFGARGTGALANVAIQGESSAGTTPTNWQFAGNCVHGGGDLATRPGMMHEIYVTAAGNTYGQITGNVLYDTPDGAAVKVGAGGITGAVGASDIVISRNTMVNNGRHVLLFGTISNISVTHNVMEGATYPMTDHRTRPAIYLNRVYGSASLIRNNYIWDATRSIFDLASAPGSWQNGGGNGIRPVAPRMIGHGCTRRPAAAAVAAVYGADPTGS